MKYVGVDGCKKGWFAIWLTDKNWAIGVFKDIATLWKKHKDATLILVDIPIGLKDKGPGERLCDIEARKLLGPKRGSSVFPVPCRSAVYRKGKSASEINQQKTGRQLSRQTLGIIPKIREMDRFLLKNRAARLHIRETHPEICFWSLFGDEPMKFRKRSKQGYLARKSVLNSAYPQANNIIKHALFIYRRKDVAKDDILDALSAAVTARMSIKGLASIPEMPQPQSDSKGLRMEIVYHYGKSN